MVQILFYHLLMIAVVFFLSNRVRKKWNDGPRRNAIFAVLSDGFLYCALGGVSALFFAVLVGVITTGQISGQRFAEGLFFEGGLFLLLLGKTFSKHLQGRFFAAIPKIIRISGVLLVLVGLYSLYYEPWALEVKTYVLESERVAKPLKIVFIADIQTDRITVYEYRAMELAKKLNGDLVLFGGDYLQYYDGGTREGAEQFNRMLRRTDFHAPLGMYAVAGNHEIWIRGWTQWFEGTGIEAVDQSTTIEIFREEDTILLDLLDCEESFGRISSQNPQPIRRLQRSGEPGGFPDPEKEKERPAFHVIMGHVPTFAVEDRKADLFLAGHTHGGQVCIPGFGPILTLTPKLPRSWGKGRTQRPDGSTLIISNGVGMERGRAPRIRFFCPPQIVVIEVLPKTDPP